MDQESMTRDELEYVCLRTICDTAMTYRDIARESGMGLPNIDEAIDILEGMIVRIASKLRDAGIVFC